MGEARDLMNRSTEAIMSGDWDTLRSLYAGDAVIETPDAGRLEGPDGLVGWVSGFRSAFPDLSWESVYEHEAGDTAIDEGYVQGTHQAALEAPGGQSIPATGKRIRVRGCDVATASNGRITSHRFYYDQLDFLGQLGLAP
jgi:steroid delta-isomerase-like uncharacterized protein